MNETREETSGFNRVQQLKEYPDKFYEQFRMSPETFYYLLATLTPRISKMDTQMRKAIDPETRLAVTLHHLATGSNHRTWVEKL